MARQVDIADLVGRAREGQPRAVAQLISLVEDGDNSREPGALLPRDQGGRSAGGDVGIASAHAPQLREVAAALAPLTGRARVLGITGPPGAGKSTSTSALVSAYRERGEKVGVLAIDPSSPFSGGALLGDRIRMSDHATDPGVFIRSMATRGHLGGMAAATPQALRVLDAAGFDVVIIETVGVGQSEVDVVRLADSTLVLLAPGMGDGIQAAKAGILEVADIFVVNKADRDGAQATVSDLKYMISLGRKEIRGAHWRQPIVRTIATTGEGIPDVLDAIDAHATWMTEHGELENRRTHRAATEVEAIAVAGLRARIGSVHGGDALDQLAKRVVAGELDPYAAADQVIDQLG